MSKAQSRLVMISSRQARTLFADTDSQCLDRTKTRHVRNSGLPPSSPEEQRVHIIANANTNDYHSLGLGVAPVPSNQGVRT